MKKHKKSIIGVVLMVLITLGVYILFKGDGNSVFTGDDTTQAVEFNDINLNEEKDGKVIWNLKARHVKMESDRNTAYLTDIEGFFAEDGNELSIKAKKGIIKRAEQTVNLEGDIEGKTKDGLILYAKNLTYDGKKQVLSTDCSFTAEKDGHIFCFLKKEFVKVMDHAYFKSGPSGAGDRRFIPVCFLLSGSASYGSGRKRRPVCSSVRHIKNQYPYLSRRIPAGGGKACAGESGYLFRDGGTIGEASG